MVRPPPASRIDRFEIKSLIGSGGMGTLYLARDTSPNTYRLVALKLLNGNLDSEDLRDRFGREARALASLGHPNVVNIHECGEHRGSPYIVMEYVRGETLAEKIKRRAPLSLSEKLKLMMELCAGLAHAHEAGIIHRDIKPANLMVDHHGRLRLLDFGIARVVESGLTMAGVQMTQINMRIGTPGYMSPEQYEGAEIDRRSDIFAVGAVFYELLTYREAFPGATTRQIEKKVLESEPERLTTQIAGLDPEIEALVVKALQKDPDKRFQDATEMERALTKVWWRLGLAESVQAPRPTPPLPGASKKGSKADAAYQRALAALDDRAPEAARRYAMEALAEDSKHEGALRFLAKHDPDFRLPNPSPPPPPPREDTWIDPTIVSSRTALNLPDLDDAQTIVHTPGQRRAGSGHGPRASGARTEMVGESRPAVWKSYRAPIGVAGAILVIAGAVLVTLVVSGQFTAPPPGGDELLTIVKPANGTIVGDDINCGTRGSACSITVAEGAMVELELVPDKGYAPGGYTEDCPPTGRVRMSSARKCGATFVPLPSEPAEVTRHTLTVLATDGGTVRVADHDCSVTSKQGCSVQFPSGQLADLEAQAERGYTFERFTGACDADGRVLMNEPKTCSVSFVRNLAMGPLAPPGGRKPAPTTIPATPGPRPDGPSTPGGNDKPKLNPGGTPGVPTGGTGGSEPPPPPGVPEGPGGAPPPPPPVKSEEEVAKSDILNVVERYRKAYEALDFEGIRQVYPTLGDGFNELFKKVTKMTYSLDAPNFVKLNVQEHAAVIRFGVSQTVQMKGEKEERPGRIKTLLVTLHRRTANNQWVILRTEHK